MTGPHRDEIVRLELLFAAHPDGRVFTHLAEAYRRAGELVRAREMLERGLLRHPDCPSAHVVLGRVFMDLEDRVGAEAAFRRVLELDPGNHVASGALGELGGSTHPPREDPAGDAAAPDEDSGLPPVLTETLARLYAEQGLYGQAAGVYRELLRGRPEDDRLRSGLREVEDRLAAAAARREEPVPQTGERPMSAYFQALLSFAPAEPKAAPAPSRPSVADPIPDTLALADLLVGLLEYRDPFFRGGSSLTRLVATAIGRELGLPQAELDALALAAVLRDLGRLALDGRLLTRPQTDPGPDVQRHIQNHVELSLQLLEGIALPAATREAIRHHHERWDGAGYPAALIGPAIPLPARILAVADSLSAMISPRPYRLPRRIPAAIEELKEAAGDRYDPAVVEALLRVLPGGARRGFGFGLRHHMILVHPDYSRAMVLAAKLCSSGYAAEAATELATVRVRMKRIPVELLVLSADLPAGAFVDFLQELREQEATASLPVVAVDADAVERRVELLDLGVDVCFSRELGFGELRAALGALLRRSTRAPDRAAGAGDGVSPWFALQGDIRDFPLAWLLQALSYDGRTAAVVVRGEEGEGAVFLEQGAAKHARAPAASGEEAIRRMLAWESGSFMVRPGARTDERTVHRPLMHLLLDHTVALDDAGHIFGAVPAG